MRMDMSCYNQTSLAVMVDCINYSHLLAVIATSYIVALIIVINIIVVIVSGT